jgi:hypothetical protein
MLAVRRSTPSWRRPRLRVVGQLGDDDRRGRGSTGSPGCRGARLVARPRRQSVVPLAISRQSGQSVALAIASRSSADVLDVDHQAGVVGQGCDVQQSCGASVAIVDSADACFSYGPGITNNRQPAKVPSSQPLPSNVPTNASAAALNEKISGGRPTLDNLRSRSSRPWRSSSGMTWSARGVGRLTTSVNPIPDATAASSSNPSRMGWRSVAWIRRAKNRCPCGPWSSARRPRWSVQG